MTDFSHNHETEDAVMQDVAASSNDAVEMYPLDRFGFDGGAAVVSQEFRNSLAGGLPDFRDLHWFSLAVRYRYKGIFANTTKFRMVEKQLLRQIEEGMAPAKQIMICVTGDIQFKVIDEIVPNGERNESPQVPPSPSWPPRVSEPGSGAKVWCVESNRAVVISLFSISHGAQPSSSLP